MGNSESSRRGGGNGNGRNSNTATAKSSADGVAGMGARPLSTTPTQRHRPQEPQRSGGRRKLQKQRSLSPESTRVANATVNGGGAPNSRSTGKRGSSGGGSQKTRKSPPAITNASDDNTSLPSNELGITKQQIQRRISSRRAKSFRNRPWSRQQNSFRQPACAITGLSANQKKLILLEWREIDTATVVAMGRNIFHTCFRRDPRLLKVLNLERYMDSTAKWRAHPRFRLHLQRFCSLLNDVVRALEDPRFICDQIREFGAAYAHMHEEENGIAEGKENSLQGGLFSLSTPAKKVPSVPDQYWDTLVFSIHNAAKDLQVERSSRSSESPSVPKLAPSRFLLPPSEESLVLKQQPQQLTISIPPLGCTGGSSYLAPPSPYSLIVGGSGCSSPAGNYSPNQLTVNTTISLPPPNTSGYYSGIESAPLTPMCYSPYLSSGRVGRSSGSVDPTVAEAWNALANFLVGQLRLGYEMERILQTALRRLSDQAAWEEEMERIAQGVDTIEPTSTTIARKLSEIAMPPPALPVVAEPAPKAPSDGPAPTFDEFPRIYFASSSNILVTNSVSQEIVSRKSSPVLEKVQG